MLANQLAGRYARLMAICYIESPVGRLALEADGDALSVVRWASPGERARAAKVPPVLKEAERQLKRYFAGRLKAFDLKLAARGTDFQKRVWKLMSDIPYGETATYGGMAMALGSGPRAVGMACGRNPLPIVVPCHRVLASGGREGGYSGGQGLKTKHKLLALEGVTLDSG
jgi:methylated-DNA-[protein]-cysteine S-methyltransferase